MTDLDALLCQLPDDPRPVASINADLEAATDAALVEQLDLHDSPPAWLHSYRAYLTAARFLRHHPEQQRLAFEIHAWRIGHVLGLDAARCPASIQLDLSKPLRLRETTLLWCRFTLDDAPWDDFDLPPLRTFTQPTDGPIGRALWRLATGSGVDRLRRQHRDVLTAVRRERLGFAALAVEEAREIVAETGQVDALRLVIELLHDPILLDCCVDDALGVLGRAQLYRARAHLRFGAPSAAAEALDRWRGLDASIRIFDEQRLLAAETKARLEMERGELAAAGDRLARSVLKIAEGSAVSTERSGASRSSRQSPSSMPGVDASTTPQASCRPLCRGSAPIPTTAPRRFTSRWSSTLPRPVGTPSSKRFALGSSRSTRSPTRSSPLSRSAAAPSVICEPSSMESRLMSCAMARASTTLSLC